MILRFTIGARSGRRGIRTLIPLAGGTASAVGSASRIRLPSVRVDPPGVEPGSPPRQGDVVPLDHGPIVLCLRSVDRRGVEPRSPACDAGVVPLDQQPVCEKEPTPIPECRSGAFLRENPPARSHEGPPENRTRSPSLPRRCAAGTPADRPAESRPGRTRTCAILFVRQASSPLDDGTSGDRRGGTRTHRHRPLRPAALPICLPGGVSRRTSPRPR